MSSPHGEVRTHRLRRMTGRDPHERHRVASPLELLYDLTLVVAFSLAGSQFAHALAEGHVRAGIAGFVVSMFAITLAWISFSWFSSAYDTDDVVMRIATLVQMVGVIVIALGLHDVFEGFAHDEFDNAILVAGYVTMRVSMVGLWLRAAAHDPGHRSTALGHARLILVAQAGWVLTALDVLPVAVQLVLAAVLFATEIVGLVWVERGGASIPFHPHHIAERYGLLAIITLGEVVLGTTTAVEAIVADQGWSLDAVVIALAGLSLAFGLWWIYFAIPFGPALEHRPSSRLGFGLGHMALFASIAAIGAGLHVAAYYVEHHSELDLPATVLTMAVPVGAFVVCLLAIYHHMLPGRDLLHLWLTVATVVVLVLAYALAAAHVSIAVCLLVLMLAPWVLVVGYEASGHRRIADRLAEVSD